MLRCFGGSLSPSTTHCTVYTYTSPRPLHTAGISIASKRFCVQDAHFGKCTPTRHRMLRTSDVVTVRRRACQPAPQLPPRLSVCGAAGPWSNEINSISSADMSQGAFGSWSWHHTLLHANGCIAPIVCPFSRVRFSTFLDSLPLGGSAAQFCGGGGCGVAGKTHLPCTWMPYHSSISSHLACISTAPARLDICRGMHQETHSAFGGTSIRPWHVQPDISYAYVCVMYAICDLDSRRARWYNTVWCWAYKDGTIGRTAHLA